MTSNHDQSRPELELVVRSAEHSCDPLAESFEPARLTRARMLAELTKAELAQKIGVSTPEIDRYETGAAHPRHLLSRLAKALNVPLGYFNSGRPLARLDKADVHFRSLRSTQAKERAKAVAYAEQVWELTYALEKRVRFPESDLPRIYEGTSPADAARLIRDRWGLPRGPVAHLGARMESHGIVICSATPTDDAISRVGAYSTMALGRPLVIVAPSRTQSVYKFRFTCAHELGHLLLHPSPIPGDQRQEREADQFAAEFLTPRIEIEPLLPKAIQLPTLGRLSEQWGVSVQALIYRMGELDLATAIAVRQASPRPASMIVEQRNEPLTSYPGEIPSLLREAFDLSERQGFGAVELAGELRWAPSYLTEILSEVETRTQLSVVR